MKNGNRLKKLQVYCKQLSRQTDFLAKELILGQYKGQYNIENYNEYEVKAKKGVLHFKDHPHFHESATLPTKKVQTMN